MSKVYVEIEQEKAQRYARIVSSFANFSSLDTMQPDSAGNMLLELAHKIDGAQTGVWLPVDEAAALVKCSKFNEGETPEPAVMLLALQAIERIRGFALNAITSIRAAQEATDDAS